MSPTAADARRWYEDGATGPSPADRARLEADAELNKRALAMRDAFSGPQGELALETILAASLFRPAVDHRLAEHEYLRFAQLREGQNSLAAVILFYLDHAQQTERNQTDEHGHGISPDAWSGGGNWTAGGEQLLHAGPGRDGDDGITFG